MCTIATLSCKGPPAFKLVAGTEHPSALMTELKDVTATMKDLADKTASTDKKLTG